MESEWLLRSTIPLRIHNTLLQKPGSQALQVCRSHFPSSGSKSLPTDDANSQLLQKEFYRSFKICRQKITSPPPRILGFLCRFPSFNQSPFFPTCLSITLSLFCSEAEEKHTQQKKKEKERTLSPNTENSRPLPCNPILSRVHSRHSPSKKFAALHTLLMLQQQAQLGKKNSTGPQSSCEARTVTTEVCKFDFTSTHTRPVSLHWRRKSRGPKSSERGNKTKEEEGLKGEGGGRLGRCQNSGPMLEEPTRQPRQP